MLPASPHHIIAIGSSAGGLEELNIFFDNTPLDGVAYIIVQHLSPDYKSRMVELLSKHSRLIVKEAENGLYVQRNEVYIIPNNKLMTINDGRLYLKERGDRTGPHYTINIFFKSLAADSGTKAIGVVLSGLGTDGTEGVMAIKKEGGLVIARNPDNAEFSSMPFNSIATGVVDFVLEPDSMPAAIEDYVNHGLELLPTGMDDEKNVKIIINIIKDQLPLDFTDYKQTTILRRIKRRATYNKISRLENYIEFLKTTPEEVVALGQDFLISVSFFFRDKEAFNYIQTEVLPRILTGLTAGEELRIWVAGCATGEEAYSLAILICEQLTGPLAETKVKIFATDIDMIALLQAGKGVYSSAIEKDVSAERLEKHFSIEGSHYRIKPDIRKMVIFAQHDLVKNPPYCNMHFISCRNLLIYMMPALQKKTYYMLLFGVKKDGFLFLGSSENPIPIIQSLEVVNKKWKIYRNLETKRETRFDTFLLPELKYKPFSLIGDEVAKGTSNTLLEAVNLTLIDEMGNLAICIDENNQVIKTYGDTSKYLLQRNFTANLTELLPRPLAIAFNTLSLSALKNSKKIAINRIKVKHNNAIISVNLSVSPLINKISKQKFLLVTFSEDNSASVAASEDTTFNQEINIDQYTKNLEDELVQLKDKLYITQLQLDASNENMQSFNEELLSANEEMQSVNEEMQSINEELHTINADYQQKNKELLELNDDLNNYFRSNINGQLFVNNDQLLMKFSPGTVKQINLLPSDIGRPLSNISTNIKFETIASDVNQVIEQGSVITKEIETSNGKWYQVMTMPYIQSDKRNGAIITFNDVTELKKTQIELDKKNESLLRINADLENFVLTASHDLIGPLSNIEISINVMSQMLVIDPRQKQLLDIINSSVKKFRGLINDISTIAKIEGDMTTMEKIDVDELINNIEWSLEHKIKSAKAIIKRDFEVKYIQFSKKNLRSLIYNLISNSIKFKNDQPPIVHLCTKKENDYVVLSVQDNGIGLAKDDLTRIFDMYGRIRTDIEGQGIGLYLAKKIVDASGGNITVESELGKGAKFTIYFKPGDVI